MIGGRRDTWPRRRVWRHRLTWRSKLVLATAALAGSVLAAVGALVAVLRSAAPPADRAVLDRLLDEQGAILFWGAVLFVGLVALGVFRLVQLYVVRPRDLAASTRLVASVNPSLRLPGGGPAELHQFAMAVNELADRYQASTADVTRRITAAQADVEAQRSRLAALMSELSLAVLVCTADGRILLYNAAASQLLNGPGTVGGPVGLGRSVFAVIDRDLVAFAIDRACSDGAAPGEAHAATVAYGESLLRAQVALVADPAAPGGASSTGGFVVTLEDLTREAVADQQRDAVLRALTADSRAAIANLRAAVESLVDYPDMPAEQQARFLAIVHDEATALSEKIETAVAAPAHLDRRLTPADMLGRDLLETLARRLQAAGLEVAAEDLPEPLLLVVDPYAVVQAVTHLGRRLLGEHRRRAVTLQLGRSGRYARLDLRWSGDGVDSRTLARWIAEPMTAAGTGSGATVSDVLASHGGEIWPGESTGTDEYLRLLLPLAERPRKAPRVAGPATEPGGGARGTRVAGRPSRPAAAYDFSLLEPEGDQVGAGWDSRPLDRISYTVFDTETTGLFPAQGDEIISIGALRIVNRRLLRQESYEQLVDPRRTVPEASIRIHGITPDLLVGMPTIEAVLPGFAGFAADTVLVGHNAAFDLQFLRAKERAGGVRFDQPVLDTLLLSAVVHPEHESHALDAVADRLGVDVIGRHTALGDAILTAEIFLRLLDLLAEHDIRTLGQARRATRAVATERFNESLYNHT
jgi:DNA polymerase-3 subunit epsilon